MIVPLSSKVAVADPLHISRPSSGADTLVLGMGGWYVLESRCGHAGKSDGAMTMKRILPSQSVVESLHYVRLSVYNYLGWWITIRGTQSHRSHMLAWSIFDLVIKFHALRYSPALSTDNQTSWRDFIHICHLTRKLVVLHPILSHGQMYWLALQ